MLTMPTRLPSTIRRALVSPSQTPSGSGRPSVQNVEATFCLGYGGADNLESSFPNEVRPWFVISRLFPVVSLAGSPGDVIRFLSIPQLMLALCRMLVLYLESAHIVGVCLGLVVRMGLNLSQRLGGVSRFALIGSIACSI